MLIDFGRQQEQTLIRKMVLFSQVKVLRALQQPLLLLSLSLSVLQPCNAAFDKSIVSGSVTGPDGSDNCLIECSVCLGDETKGKDVEDIVLFAADDQDQIHATTTNVDLEQGVTSIVQHSVAGFKPMKFLLMGATPGTVGGIEPDKPHVVIVSTSSFQADVAGCFSAKSFSKENKALRFQTCVIRLPPTWTIWSACWPTQTCSTILFMMIRLQASRFFTFLARFPMPVHGMEGTVVLTETAAALMTIALVRIALPILILMRQAPVLHRLHPNPPRLPHPHPLPSRKARKVLSSFLVPALPRQEARRRTRRRGPESSSWSRRASKNCPASSILPRQTVASSWSR
jgi:hypothetical protein